MIEARTIQDQWLIPGGGAEGGGQKEGGAESWPKAAQIKCILEEERQWRRWERSDINFQLLHDPQIEFRNGLKQTIILWETLKTFKANSDLVRQIERYLDAWPYFKADFYDEVGKFGLLELVKFEVQNGMGHRASQLNNNNIALFSNKYGTQKYFQKYFWNISDISGISGIYGILMEFRKQMEQKYN